MKRTSWQYTATVFCVTAISFTLVEQSRAQEDSYDCVMESKSTIELQSAEEGILDRVLVERGDQVKKGAVVARLDSKQEAIIAEHARLRTEGEMGVLAARAQAEYRRKELDRLAELRASNSVPLREIATAEVESRLADIEVETAIMEQEMAQLEYEQAKLHLDRRSIRTPVDGIVVDVTMYPGEYVHEQATVMTIAEVNPLYVEMFVPVSEYNNVRKGMAAEVRPEEPIGGVHNAEVAVVDHVFDAASRTFRVRLILPNEDYALPAGLRCSVRFLETEDAGNVAQAD
jgi:RND family efflux transporter MFP subunit